MISVGLVGDHDPAVTAHRAIPLALELAGAELGVRVAHAWVPTERITDDQVVAGFDALWCVPASPYRSMEGALRAIRFARTQGTPFLGTCGGFQHAVVEYARSVLGWADAEHAETAPDSVRAVIAPLACALVEVSGAVRLDAAARIGRIYGRDRIEEGYHCSYGLNPAFRAALQGGPLRVGAVDDSGEVRAIELDDHPFFIATLFQPERAALRGETPPLAVALLQAAAGRPFGAEQRRTPAPGG